MTGYLSISIALHSALIFTVEGGDPNDAQTLDYVPGAALRGALAGRLVSQGAAQEEFDRLILDGSVRFLNAYPVEPPTGHRALPIPASWRLGKNDPARWARDVSAGWPSAQMGGFPARFCTWDSDEVVRVDVARNGRVHQQRDRARGRAWTERRKNGDEIAHGTIFAYESIDPGQRFRGLIAIDAEDDAGFAATADRIREVLNGAHRIGRSKRSEYGGMTVRIGDGPAREFAQQLEPVAAGGEFRAVLLSDYAGREWSTGQLDPGALAPELIRRLGGRASVERSFVEPVAIGGYNRHWGLPRPLGLGVRAGSVLVLRAAAAIASGELRAIEDAGLGERREEGFGRIAFLPPAMASVQIAPPQPVAPAPLPSAGPPAIVGAIERRMLEREFARRISNHAANLVQEAPPERAGSVLGRLRGQLRGVEAAEGLAVLRTWLTPGGKHELRESGRKHLARCRVGSRSLTEWLKNVLDEPDSAKVLLEPAPRAWLLSDAAAAEYVTAEGDRLRARLIDEVLKALALRARARRRSDAQAQDAEQPDAA